MERKTRICIAYFFKGDAGELFLKYFVIADGLLISSRLCSATLFKNSGQILRCSQLNKDKNKETDPAIARK